MKKLLVVSLLAVALGAEEKVDLGVIQRIKKEAFQNSKVMDHLFWLSDVYGPRLTGYSKQRCGRQRANDSPAANPLVHANRICPIEFPISVYQSAAPSGAHPPSQLTGMRRSTKRCQSRFRC